MNILAKLRYGRHHKLFENGLAQTARLAWGIPRPADPTLATWLENKDLFEQHGNGVVVFSSRLVARAKAEGLVPNDRLLGIMRWLYTHDSYAIYETGQAVDALSQIGSIIIAGGWSDVASGHKPRSETHFSWANIAIKPCDKDRIDEVLLPLGWQSTRTGYLKRMEGRRRVTLNIAPKLAHVDWPSQADRTDGIIHANGPALTLMLAQQLVCTSNPNIGAQLLDRIMHELSDAQSLEDIRGYAAQKNATHILENALKLLAKICGKAFEARLNYPAEIAT